MLSLWAAATAAAASIQIFSYQSPYFATRKPTTVPELDDA